MNNENIIAAWNELMCQEEIAVVAVYMETDFSVYVTYITKCTGLLHTILLGQETGHVQQIYPRDLQWYKDFQNKAFLSLVDLTLPKDQNGNAQFRFIDKSHLISAVMVLRDRVPPSVSYEMYHPTLKNIITYFPIPHTFCNPESFKTMLRIKGGSLIGQMDKLEAKAKKLVGCKLQNDIRAKNEKMIEDACDHFQKSLIGLEQPFQEYPLNITNKPSPELSKASKPLGNNTNPLSIYHQCIVERTPLGGILVSAIYGPDPNAFISSLRAKYKRLHAKREKQKFGRDWDNGTWRNHFSEVRTRPSREDILDMSLMNTIRSVYGFPVAIQNILSRSPEETVSNQVFLQNLVDKCKSKHAQNKAISTFAEFLNRQDLDSVRIVRARADYTITIKRHLNIHDTCHVVDISVRRDALDPLDMTMDFSHTRFYNSNAIKFEHIPLHTIKSMLVNWLTKRLQKISTDMIHPLGIDHEMKCGTSVIALQYQVG